MGYDQTARSPIFGGFNHAAFLRKDKSSVYMKRSSIYQRVILLKFVRSTTSQLYTGHYTPFQHITAYFYLRLFFYFLFFFFFFLLLSTPKSPFGHKCSQHLQTKCYTLRMFYTLVPTLLLVFMYNFGYTLLLLTHFFFHQIARLFHPNLPFSPHFCKYLPRILALLTPFVSIKIAGDLLLRLFITLIRTHSWNSCCSLQQYTICVLACFIGVTHILCDEISRVFNKIFDAYTTEKYVLAN